MVDLSEKLNKNIMKVMNDQQKTIFLKTLLFASKVDGDVDNNEVQYIKKMSVKYKVNDIKKIFEPISEGGLLVELRCLTERTWALELVKELFRLGHEDGDLGDEEVLFIGRVGRALGVENEKIEQISSWVIDYLIWKEQGKVIFEENS